MYRRQTAGFTIVEIIVVVGIITVLLGLSLVGLRSVRITANDTKCASNLRNLSQACLTYMVTYKDHLPQVAVEDPFSGEDIVVGALFGGKRGTLELYGINEIGAKLRPLNAYVASNQIIYDDDPSDGIQEEVPVFESPLDKGQPAQPPFLPQVNSMYDFVGTSYNLNDHTLDSEDCGTLVPKSTLVGVDADGNDITKPGGRMPRVDQPEKTWMIAPHPIYNYQEGGDRGQDWHPRGVVVSMAFVDGHVVKNITVPEGIQNTTKDYTFLPSQDWECAE